ncbi:hypothetical protein [Halobacterium litoreum]|uniref:Uncharacterized protein n=1 Tax=Halobacterium litoreum TaxID=2039234 RepID=A0ABD5NCJ7_9EURY|nr:hypothetical protein [Halobacterium litoreum]UHH14241.1 hypothetical protein LT972_04380 [Halobacterium litoreum]
MVSWIDPHDSKAEAWGGNRDVSMPEAIESTEERAHRVELPFQYREHRSYERTLDGVEIGGVTYPSGNFVVNGGIAADRTLKLHARGLLWQRDSGENARRFKMQLVRDPPVTDSVPFGDYRSWERFQLGEVNVDDVTGPSFDPDPSTNETRRDSTPFGDLLEPLKRRVAELELVRNPAFAKYRLEERDEWETYGAVFRWQANAFQQRVS